MAKTDTKQQLIEVAERLFAKEGIHAVSMRRISSEAGQRNNSALQYHFGSKQQLIEAILASRMATINKRRMELLDQAINAQLGDSVRALVTVIVMPLVEQLQQSPTRRSRKKSHYLQFLIQLSVTEFNFSWMAELDENWIEALHKISQRLLDLLSHIPEKVLNHRMRLMGEQLTQAFATQENIHNNNYDQAQLMLFANNLIDYISAALTATPSNETLELLNTTLAR